MRPSVTIRSLQSQRRSLPAWMLGLVSLAGTYVALYPSIKGDATFTRILDEMPKAYRAMFTSGAGDFTSPAGYLNTELLTLMGPLLVILYAVGSGSSALAGEEERRTLDLLLANPISRRRVLLEKFAALAAGVGLLVAVLWTALVVGGGPAGLALPAGRTAAALVHLGLLGLQFGALALLVGAATGHVAASRALPALIAVAAYLVNALAPLVSWLRPLRKLSPFYLYIGHDPLRTGFSVAGIAVGLATTAVLVAVAIVAFGRRDIRS